MRGGQRIASMVTCSGLVSTKMIAYTQQRELTNELQSQADTCLSTSLIAVANLWKKGTRASCVKSTPLKKSS